MSKGQIQGPLCQLSAKLLGQAALAACPGGALCSGQNGCLADAPQRWCLPKATLLSPSSCPQAGFGCFCSLTQVVPELGGGEVAERD